MSENNEGKLKKFFKSYHTENFKWNDFLIVPLFLSLLLLTLGQLVGDLIINATFPKLFNDNVTDYIIFFAMYFSFIGIWVVALLYFLTPGNRPMFGAIWKKCKGNTLKNLGIGLLIGFGTNAFCILCAVLNKDIFLYYSGENFLAILGIFIAVFIQSSAEELICRGFLYQRLRRGYKNPLVAIIGNSVLFALLHIFNPGVEPIAIVSIVVVGILYSLLVYYFDSIWMPMAIHAGWNFTQSIFFGLPNSGIVSKFSIFKMDAASAKDSFAYSTSFGVEATILAVAVNILCCLIIFYLGRKNNKKPTDIWN
ncbi:MAG: CPBP family intramembrane metalloprotease [Butyrivibrio sp.]|uniref:CPBP family intramembrane glutamic endopeptidase n=1 Tax=Butyrivibrio sp. TaxID=28121 RepID=UPI001AFCF490|nr:type II CAAX endopeptidase family protein [Butyrivibrio sp.]MBO6240163.1 CPBP family intramembrane metalloprotease [Butyrivibrio sp.]